MPGTTNLNSVVKSCKSTKGTVNEAQSDDETLVVFKLENGITRTDLPSFASTRVDELTQVDTLAIAFLVGDTELVTVGMPGGAASTNFLNPHFTVPRMFSNLHEVLKHFYPDLVVTERHSKVCHF